VSADGLASLHNLIKQDAHTLNGTSIQRLERHVQKLANAAQASFAESAFIYDQNQMLIRMNKEAKVRRSTKSIVLGKAKVMSFEDIEVARAARAAKEVIKGKGKRGRKRKSVASEADEPEPEPEVARIIEGPEPWRAPVARMI
jgi:septum formation inhibitor MinC